MAWAVVHVTQLIYACPGLRGCSSKGNLKSTLTECTRGLHQSTQILRLMEPLPLVVCTDSKSLYECLVKLGSTQEKRLMIDLMALREAFERMEINEVKWISGNSNPADAMTKAKPCSALSNLVNTNKLDLHVGGMDGARRSACMISFSSSSFTDVKLSLLNLSLFTLDAKLSLFNISLLDGKEGTVPMCPRKASGKLLCQMSCKVHMATQKRRGHLNGVGPYGPEQVKHHDVIA